MAVEKQSTKVTKNGGHIDMDLAEAFGGKREKAKETWGKKSVIFLVAGIVGIIGGVVCLVVGIFGKNKIVDELSFPQIGEDKSSEAVYSDLTGEPLADATLKTAPAYCIQTPNGTDGARPQAGLNEAGVVFEAIAEAGITRFAAIYQNPTAAVIGPIRSLRIYYLEWDTPFDCTIVHAGGADDALQAVAAGGYQDLSENYTYMYRGTYGARLWNNLFTTAAYLKQFSADRGYNTSEIKGFARLTPEDAKKARVDATVREKLNIVEPADGDTSEMVAEATTIKLNFGGWANFNVVYNYDEVANQYLRSYESGVAHDVYACASENLGEKNPEDVCSLMQPSPSVVIAMMVQEEKASDNYHENIKAIGSGRAYIFQNGTAVEGTWSKSSRDEQIKFFDGDGNEVALVPGQTFVSAVPNYGSVEY